MKHSISTDFLGKNNQKVSPKPFDTNNINFTESVSNSLANIKMNGRNGRNTTLQLYKTASTNLQINP